MARPRNAQEQAAAASDPTVEEREADADAVEDQFEQEEKAAEKRQADAERAANLKSVPDDSDAPTERMIGGDKAYSVERLISEAPDFLDGVASHEMAGALYGTSQEYLTLKDAEKAVKDFRAREV